MNWIATIFVLVLLCYGKTPDTQRSRFHIVKIKRLKFTPKELFIDLNDTVQWINETNASHRIVAGDNSLASPVLKKGGAYMHVFRKTGFINYACPLHQRAGKKGVVKVIID
jgi:plastocyanin